MPNIVCYDSIEKTSARKGKIDYIVIHYTAGASSLAGVAVANAKYYANKDNNTQASADFFVDDKTIVQYNRDLFNRYTWAVGSGKSKYNTHGGKDFWRCTNRNSVSIEMCSSNRSGKMTTPNDPNYYFTDFVINNTVILVRYLMDVLNIDADHVIRHYDVTGKLCPGIIGWNEDSGNTRAWDAFKTRLTEAEKVDINTLTEYDCYKIMEKARRYYASQPLPATWDAESELKEAVKTGITDGTRPMDMTSRLETAVMIKRAMKAKE